MTVVGDGATGAPSPAVPAARPVRPGPAAAALHAQARISS